MPIQHLGTIPAKTPPLTQMLQGLAGGLQTGMGYYQQAQERKAVLAQLSLEELDKTAESAWEMWKIADTAGKSAIESGIKANPELIALMEDRFYWTGGPEGGFLSLAIDEADLPVYKATKMGDDVLLWNESDPKDTHLIVAEEEPKEDKWLQGAGGYWQPVLPDGTMGEQVYIGPEKDTSNVHVRSITGGFVYVDESDPMNPVVLKTIVVPTAAKTPADLLADRNEKIKQARIATTARLQLKYPASWIDIIDKKERAKIGSQLAADYREWYMEELMTVGFDKADAQKISGGVPFPLDPREIYAAWVAASPDRRADIELLVKRKPELVADLEEHPELWDAEAGTFIVPTEELNWLQQLLQPDRVKGERPIDKWMGLDEIEFEGAVPTEPAKVPKVIPLPKEDVLYAPEINEQVEADKKYAEDNPGSLGALQTFLKEKGYWDYNITDKWTPELERALREFYRDQTKGL